MSVKMNASLVPGMSRLSISFVGAERNMLISLFGVKRPEGILMTADDFVSIATKTECAEIARAGHTLFNAPREVALAVLSVNGIEIK